MSFLFRLTTAYVNGWRGWKSKGFILMCVLFLDDGWMNGVGWVRWDGRGGSFVKVCILIHDMRKSTYGIVL